MPIYEYQCGSCDHKFEALQKMSEDPLRDCPACHAPKLKKLVSAAAFKLKGGGWYETDFKNSNKKPAAASEAGQSAGATDNKAEKSSASNQGSQGSTKTQPGKADHSSKTEK